MSNPTICLAMIVKDEEKIIADCLKSIPSDLIDYWVIHDTGSSDQTPQKIEEVMNPKIGLVEHVHWDNFGSNKTKLLDSCREKSDYVLMMDADHIFNPKYSSEEIKKSLIDNSLDQLLIKMESSVDYRLPQLIKNNRQWLYIGVTHEYLDSKTPYVRGNFDGFTIKETDKGSSRADKFQRDAFLLEEGLKQEQGNSRYLYYLAQSYLGLGLLPLALSCYRQRANMKFTWEEERWHAEYKAITIREMIEPPEAWKSLVNDYIECFRGRPSRLEPLARAVKICRTKQEYHTGWRLAAMGKLNPPTDILFIEPGIYDWEFVFEAGICAYYAGDKKWFRSAMEGTLSSNAPDIVKQAAKENLKFQ